MIAANYPLAEVEYLDPGGFGAHFGAPWIGVQEPERVASALAMHAQASESELVSHVNLTSMGFGVDVVWGEPQVIEEELIELDCLRTFSAEGTLDSETSIPSPLGDGKVLNDDCWDLP